MRNDIHKKIEKGQFDSVYVLYGTESYFLEETLHLLINNGLEEDEKEFNLLQYDLDEQYLEEAIEDASTPPFFGERKVVIVKNALFLTGQKEKLAQNVTTLANYLENPAPFTIVIFLVPYEKLDERKKITKAMKQHSAVVQCNQLDQQGIKEWIKMRCHTYGISIEESAIEMLLALVGNNMLMMEQEFEKLQLYVGENGTVTEDVVTLLVSKSVEQNVFMLVEKVLQGNVKEGLNILKDLLNRQEEPIKILALFASQFRLLYGTKELADIGYGQNQIASHLGVHPYRVKLALGQVRHYSKDYLRNVVKKLAQADYEMKTGKLDKKLILELFIVNLGKR
ncbi:MAG: DNA polymerase III subunit delta [Bacillaceae bacterium]